MGRGRLVVFEGIDGTGKTTQIEKLKETLLSLGEDILVTSEPGGTELGKSLKILLHQNDFDRHTSFFLHLAAANEHMTQVIEPALSSGKIVLCDRHSLSRYAYQGSGNGISGDLINSCEDHISGIRNIHPELSFVFLLDPSEAYARSVKRDGNPCNDEKDFQKMKRISDFYKRFSMSNQVGVVPIDARNSPDDIAAKITLQTLRMLASRPSLEPTHTIDCSSRRDLRVR